MCPLILACISHFDLALRGQGPSERVAINSSVPSALQKGTFPPHERILCTLAFLYWFVAAICALRTGISALMIKTN